MINILIVDDRTFVHKTLKTYLESEPDLNIVGFANNGKEAIERVAALNPDVVLMDIEMPIMDGLSATQIIVQHYTHPKILILTIQNNQEHLDRAFKAGAKGYWLKNTTAKELANAVRYVHKGYFQLALELIDKYQPPTSQLDSQLTDKQELDKKLDILDTVLAKVEGKFSNLQELTPKKLNQTIENTVKQEINLRKERDANLQYKIDRLQQKLKRLEKNLSLLAKIQLVCNLILFIAVGYCCYVILTNLVF
ncbi:response regulator [Myxosarcina sp. GI1]|uniref:response regulator n=1 Tax=Myxosarcina sp. GI1 TaxID=1541065 RepID=UPI00069128A3|nr:response regulator [Myxosarcina sp. GI1]